MLFSFSANGKNLHKANLQLRKAEQQLKALLNSEISLTQVNVDASNANIDELNAELERISTELSRGAQLSREEDGVRVIASIQQYISDRQRQAEELVNKVGEATPVELPNDFAFGFDAFFDESDVPESVEEISYLNNQRQVLEFILSKLFARPGSSTIARYISGNLDNAKSDSSIFTIGDAVTAAREGAIETLAFKVAFTGDTASLRTFLSELNQFEYLIVVRSVDVERPSGRDNRCAERNQWIRRYFLACFWQSGVFCGGSTGCSNNWQSCIKHFMIHYCNGIFPGSCR